MLFLTVCSGAFLWALLIVVKKVYLDRYKTHEDVVVVATMFGAAAVCAVGEVIMFGLGRTTISNSVWLPLIVTAVINVGIQYWGVLALKYEDASIVAPLSATMPFWVIFLSFLILGEWPTFWGRVGIGLIGLGAYLVRLEPGSGRGGISFLLGPWLRLFHSKGARLALATALLGGVAINFDKLVVLRSSPMFLTAGCFFFVGLTIRTWSGLSGRWSGLDRKMLWPLFGWGMVLGVANILMNLGFYWSIAPYVGSLKRTQILWVVVMSGMFLGEKFMFLRLIAAALIFAGAVAMMF